MGTSSGPSATVGLIRTEDEMAIITNVMSNKVQSGHGGSPSVIAGKHDQNCTAKHVGGPASSALIEIGDNMAIITNVMRISLVNFMS
ncbi:unnamed protein product [Microthlaspi erraticum]|uniref:Uncharacterized protein n=1 Tax=Microthlaspi erraticum TaxID=1685480 RepID=A0A6D2KU27_9BRAS|nr:unnamed protein product [Microthlaspi erraticum]